MASEEEEKFFKLQEAERRAVKRRELEKAAKELQERRKVARSVATTDEAMVARIRDLGFDGDTARVFDLLPLIHVAWADGSVSAAEHRQIFAVLEQREIEPGSEAFVLVESLLEERPSAAFLDETLDVLRGIVASGGGRPHTLLEACTAVAQASGGFLGFGDRIADEEKALIEKIADALGNDAIEKFGDSLVD